MDSFLRYYTVLNNLRKRSSINTDDRESITEEPEDEHLVDNEKRPCRFIYN